MYLVEKTPTYIEEQVLNKLPWKYTNFINISFFNDVVMIFLIWKYYRVKKFLITAIYFRVY